MAGTGPTLIENRSFPPKEQFAAQANATELAYTHDVVFDHKPGASVYWCTADIGWVTGHSGREGWPRLLVLDKPWPAMLLGIWADEERYRETYWSRFAEHGYYFAGDGAKYDDDGGALWLLGRVDDVMNVSGHRISTAEVESALVSHPTVAEAAVIGASDPTVGQAIVAFVILRGTASRDEAERETTIRALGDHVANEIGPIAKPKQILVVDELPKTRSGKIMRRLLRDVAEGREAGDQSTLADSGVMGMISAGMKSGSAD